ncbi:MAG: hypothetical protein ACW99G_04930 [Candidatus Thorarchaeota archaeon]|jgi:hypothetical protein
MKFKEGDRVVVTHEFMQSQERMPVGLTCTILVVHKNRKEYGVQWDELPPFRAHTLDGRAKSGHGWWLSGLELDRKGTHEQPSWEL